MPQLLVEFQPTPGLRNLWSEVFIKKHLRAAMKQVGQLIQRSAQAKVRVRTGRLRENIESKPWTSRYSVGVNIYPPVREKLGIPADYPWYYPYSLEFGFTRRKGQKGIRRRRILGAIVPTKNTTVTVPAYPFMAPALDENEARVRTMIQDAMTKAIKG